MAKVGEFVLGKRKQPEPAKDYNPLDAALGTPKKVQKDSKEAVIFTHYLIPGISKSQLEKFAKDNTVARADNPAGSHFP